MIDDEHRSKSEREECGKDENRRSETLYSAVLFEAEICKFLITLSEAGKPLLMTSVLCHNILIHKRGEKYSFAIEIVL